MAAIDQPPAVVCSVLREERGEQIQIRGRVVSKADLRGTYSLSIRKSGPSGTSSVKQGGQLAVPANTETFVGFASFNADPETRFVVDFHVQVDGKIFACDPQDGEAQ
jgi:hypothetical protein